MDHARRPRARHLADPARGTRLAGDVPHPRQPCEGGHSRPAAGSSGGQIEAGSGRLDDEEHAGWYPFPPIDGQLRHARGRSLTIIHGLGPERDGWRLRRPVLAGPGCRRHRRGRPRRAPAAAYRAGGAGKRRLAALVARIRGSVQPSTPPPRTPPSRPTSVSARRAARSVADPDELVCSAVDQSPRREKTRCCASRVAQLLEANGPKDDAEESWLSARRNRWVMGNADEGVGACAPHEDREHAADHAAGLPAPRPGPDPPDGSASSPRPARMGSADMGCTSGPRLAAAPGTWPSTAD